MKRIFRAVIFSATAILLTSVWNKGFKISYDPAVFIKISLLVALFYYLVMPISKIILLPVNFITLGLLSVILNVLLFYFFFTRFSLAQIQPWVFPGTEILGNTIKPVQIGYFVNILVSSASLSFIIKLLELLL